MIIPHTNPNLNPNLFMLSLPPHSTMMPHTNPNMNPNLYVHICLLKIAPHVTLSFILHLDCAEEVRRISTDLVLSYFVLPCLALCCIVLCCVVCYVVLHLTLSCLVLSRLLGVVSCRDILFCLGIVLSCFALFVILSCLGVLLCCFVL